MRTFGPDYYPTPLHVIKLMLQEIDIAGKTILEPSAGNGNIVDQLHILGAGSVLGCEIHPELRTILASKCKVIEHDFLNLTADKISHIDCIIMNPPFSEAEKHFLHAYNIAPAGCQIVSLCNSNMLSNLYSKSRQELKEIIDTYGRHESLGDCFGDADRKTGVLVSMINVFKPSVQGENEFEGFFMEEEPNESGSAGLMPYNFIRDLVQRYITAVEIFDKQLILGIEMEDVLGSYFDSKLCFTISEKGQTKTREEFKKDMQVSGWYFIFKKMRMEKYETAGLREDLNKFIQKQSQIPFTMKNIYRMLEIVIGTHGSRMDKALLEVFEKATKHHDDNKYFVEGWKTNSHYLLNKKFILPNMCYQDKRWHSGSKIETNYGGYFQLMEDMLKSLCYLTGKPYESFCSLDKFLRYEYKFYNDGIFIDCEHDYHNSMYKLDSWKAKYPNLEVKKHLPIYGEVFEWAFFTVRCYKKGTIHFEFKDQSVWELVNKTVARLLGYPLYEPKKKAEPKPTAEPVKQTAKAGESLVLFNL